MIVEASYEGTLSEVFFRSYCDNCWCYINAVVSHIGKAGADHLGAVPGDNRQVIISIIIIQSKWPLKSSSGTYELRNSSIHYSWTALSPLVICLFVPHGDKDKDKNVPPKLFSTKNSISTHRLNIWVSRSCTLSSCLRLVICCLVV